MSNAPQIDWFAQNAPPQPTTQPSGDWFSQNAPPQPTAAQAEPEQPGFLSKVLEGLKQSSIGQIVAPPQNSTEAHIALIGGPQTLMAYRSAKGLVTSAENSMKATGDKYIQSIKDFQQMAEDYKNKDYRNLASDVASAGADIQTIQGNPVSERVRELSEGARPGGNLVTPVTKDVADAAALGIGGMELGPEEETGADVAEAPSLGARAKQVVTDIRQGKAAEQAPAQSAIRQATNAPADQPIIEGNKSILDQKLADLSSQKQAAYKQMDDAVGFDLKAEKDALANDQYKLKQLGNTEADESAREKLQASIADSQQRISDAESTLKARGIDPKGADKLNQQLMAGKQIKKALVTSTRADGSVDVNGFLNRIKNLRFDKFGDRPAQFFGKDTTDQLVQDLQDAHNQGIRAVSRQRIAGIIGKGILGTAAGATGGALIYDTLKK